MGPPKDVSPKRKNTRNTDQAESLGFAPQ